MSEKSIIATFAYQVICKWVTERTRFRLEPVPPELSERAACFVSIHLISDGSLRGCIGTIYSRFPTLHDEVQHNAISAAENDTRFSPLRPDELDNLYVTVDVLSIPEKTSIDNLDPKKFGVIVELDGYQRAVLLPNIPGVDTVEQQIKIVKRKANLSMFSNDELTFYRFTSKRYEPL